MTRQTSATPPIEHAMAVIISSLGVSRVAGAKQTATSTKIHALIEVVRHDADALQDRRFADLAVSVSTSIAMAAAPVLRAAMNPARVVAAYSVGDSTLVVGASFFLCRSN